MIGGVMLVYNQVLEFFIITGVNWEQEMTFFRKK